MNGADFVKSELDRNAKFGHKWGFTLPQGKFSGSAEKYAGKHGIFNLSPFLDNL